MISFQLVVLGVSQLSLLQAVQFVFSAIEKGASPEFKKRLSKTILEKEIGFSVRSLSIYLINLIEKIYTQSHFSWKCFARSMYTSFLFIVVLHSIFFFRDVSNLVSLQWGFWLSFFVETLIFFLVYNSFDFFLLWKTRKILHQISRKTKSSPALYFSIDLILTFSIAVIKFIVLMIALDKDVRWDYFINDLLVVHIPEKFSSANRTVPGIFFYSTFVYSAFTFLYFLSYYLLKLFSLIEILKKGLMKIIDPQEEPIFFLKAFFGALYAILLSIILLIIGLN